MDRIASASASVRLVSAADKLHNIRSILKDYRMQGDLLWDLFKGGKQGTLWYYRSLVTAFNEAHSTPIVMELDRLVTELERLVQTQRGEVLFKRNFGFTEVKSQKLKSKSHTLRIYRLEILMPQ
ncbi:hypothetical protein CYANOKiyG1_24990 [Okeania sp. KiyG1]|nr:hypothetical protein CYANOKiyG1_24990 [Okeania sp. KiyG1]